MSIRLVKAPLDIVFSLSSKDIKSFEQEFERAAHNEDDPISSWLKLAKAKGETAESDPVLLNLLVELHRKVDNIERIIKNEDSPKLLLDSKAKIESIGFEYIKLEDDFFDEGSVYYIRVDVPVHPRHEMSMFVKAQSKNLVKILKISEQDEKEWAAFMVSRERIMIRSQKEKA